MRKAATPIPAPLLARLRECFDYDPDTGLFFWKVSKRGIRRPQAGCFAGGYTVIQFDGVRYRAHRLAWFYVHGEWPAHEVDHINGIRSDNRIENLRLATHAENLRNQKLQARNTSGCKGVAFDRSRNKWMAQIHVAGKNINLGRFDTLNEASDVVKRARLQHHGEFARVA
jgi:hypothetical protein